VFDNDFDFIDEIVLVKLLDLVFEFEIYPEDLVRSYLRNTSFMIKMNPIFSGDF